MAVATCQHIKPGGARCGSPALRGQDYCYFHIGAHRTIPSVNLWPTGELPSRNNPQSLDAVDQNLSRQRYEPPNEAVAIQIGFARLIRGVTQGLLNARQAKLILSALHKAAADRRNGTATGSFAVTSNELGSPISTGSRASSSESRGG